jgi:hypothetical protein
VGSRLAPSSPKPPDRAAIAAPPTRHSSPLFCNRQYLAEPPGDSSADKNALHADDGEAGKGGLVEARIERQ